MSKRIELLEWADLWFPHWMASAESCCRVCLTEAQGRMQLHREAWIEICPRADAGKKSAPEAQLDEIWTLVTVARMGPPGASSGGQTCAVRGSQSWTLLLAWEMQKSKTGMV